MVRIWILQVFLLDCLQCVSLASISHGSSVNTRDVREDFYYTVTIPSFQFLGTAYTSINIQEIGVLTFAATPFGGTQASYTFDQTWIAPYGADIGGGTFGNILDETFGSGDTTVVQYVSSAVDSVFTSDSFVPTSVYLVTWQDVRLYPSNINTAESTFQAALATDGTKTYILFLYDNLQWTPAVVGIGSGDVAVFHEVCQSGTSDVKHLVSLSQSQCGLPGVLVFRVDQTTWQPVGYQCTNAVPSGNCSISSANVNMNRDQRCAA